MNKRLVMPYPRYAEIAYERDLLVYARGIKLLIIKNFIEKYQFVSSYKGSIKKDDISSDLKNALEDINFQAKILATKLIGSLLNRAQSVNLFNHKAFSKIVGSVQEVTAKINLEIELWVLENSRLIKSISERLLDKTVEAVHESISNLESISGFKSMLRDIFNFGDNLAKIIARAQIKKLNGSVIKERNLSLGINDYMWLTGRDDRVRASHSVLEGKTCAWQNAHLYKNQTTDKKWRSRTTIHGVEKHPGEDFNCRCTSIAVIKSGAFV